jgi:hypothetical protein
MAIRKTTERLDLKRVLCPTPKRWDIRQEIGAKTLSPFDWILDRVTESVPSVTAAGPKRIAEEALYKKEMKLNQGNRRKKTISESNQSLNNKN